MGSPILIPAVQYQIRNYDGFKDIFSGGGELVTETFIPSVKIAYNKLGEVFYTNEPRNKEIQDPLSESPTIITHPLTEVKLDSDLVQKITNVAILQLTTEKAKNELLPDLMPHCG